jgi:SnoaL-like domain
MFARAWESADLDALVALLTDDVFIAMPPMPFFIAMPPMPFGYEGRDAVTRFCASLFAAGRRFDLVPARANGQPAFGAYLRVPAGICQATGFYVLTLAGGRICAMTASRPACCRGSGCRDHSRAGSRPPGRRGLGGEARTGGRAGTSANIGEAAEAHTDGRTRPQRARLLCLRKFRLDARNRNYADSRVASAAVSRRQP